MMAHKNLFGNLLVCALLLSCAKETVQPVQPVQEGKTYTLSVEAGKGERPDTKTLLIDGMGSLNAYWAVGEQVSVYKADALLGTLSAVAGGEETTLSGTITGDLSVDDNLTLKFLSPDYDSQDGTLAYIAANCDHAVASVTVTNVEGTGVTTTKASFVNRQAIVRFSLNVSARPLMITVADRNITVTPVSATDVLYVAVPAISDKPILLKTKLGETTYMLHKNGVTLEAGKYYDINANLSSAIVVHNEGELTAARQTDNAQILFANDIAIGSLLEI